MSKNEQLLVSTSCKVPNLEFSESEVAMSFRESMLRFALATPGVSGHHEVLSAAAAYMKFLKAE